MSIGLIVYCLKGVLIILIVLNLLYRSIDYGLMIGIVNWVIKVIYI